MRGQSRSRAFYIETLLLVLFVILSLAVIMQVFGGAWKLSKEAKMEADAVLLADNSCAMFEADPEAYLADGDTQGIQEQRFNGDGSQDENGEYTVTVDADSEDRGNGQMYTAHVSVYNDDGALILEEDTAKYLSNKEADHEQ